jgi:Kef-type K+ transport system membrane component KefB/nucleotide-binding universal stress UspA family protein
VHFLLLLILQIGVVLVAARLCGLLFRRIRQPQVVGEMAAGILLGPSLLGWVAPDVSAFLFPPQSLAHLNTLSQVGLVLFMFLVGLEFDPKLLRGRGHAAVVTSHVSIIAPFFLGSILALHLYPQLSDSSVSFQGFALFMGAAMSVTAFPVLARILAERNLMRTRVGAVTIACAAVDDVTAWSILAVVVAVVRADALETPLWVTLAGTAAFVCAMLFAVRPALRRLEARYHAVGRFTQDMLAIVLLLVLASAWTTEWLGIHALFGAFLFGTVMPKDRGLVHDVSIKLEDLTVVFLLPLFFANAGLRTSIGLVEDVQMWGFFGLVMLVAVAGKLGGSTLSARITGLSWRESGALGILMNTRGLMELVILTIGLEIGVISPALFTMMVMMALVTTAMTTPVVQWLFPSHVLRSMQAEDAEPGDFTVVVPVSLPTSGPGLLQVARAMVPESRALRVYGLHLRRPSETAIPEIDPGDSVPGGEMALQPLLRAADATDTTLRPLAFVSERPAIDIVDVARVKGAQLVVMGWHKPVVSSKILGGVVHDVMTRAPCDVAVYVQRSVEPWRRIVVPFREAASDGASLDAALRIGKRTGIPVTVLRVLASTDAPGIESLADAESRRSLKQATARGAAVRAVRTDAPVDAVVDAVKRDGYDLVVIGVGKAWGLTPAVFGVRHERIVAQTTASVLIVRSSRQRSHDEAHTRERTVERDAAASG